jgi:putative oxidoreductase
MILINMELRKLNIGLLILRLNFGALMLFHGVYKLLNGLDGIKGMLSDLGMPSFLAYGVHLGETIAPF